MYMVYILNIEKAAIFVSLFAVNLYCQSHVQVQPLYNYILVLLLARNCAWAMWNANFM